MLQPILNDGISGSSVLLGKVLSWMESLLATGTPLPETALDQLLTAHGGMACFVHLHRFFSIHDLSEASLAAFRQRISREERAMLESFRSCFPGDINHLAVYSHSGMVLKALRVLKRPLQIDVALCAPEGEGQAMAEALNSIPAVEPCLWSDGAYFSRIPEAEAVVLGCDAISPKWFVNRGGTRAIVALAARSGIPVFVVEGPLKSLTDGELIRLPLKQGHQTPGTEWEGAVKWRSPLLEIVGTEGVYSSGKGLIGPMCF